MVSMFALKVSPVSRPHSRTSQAFISCLVRSHTRYGTQLPGLSIWWRIYGIIRFCRLISIPTYFLSRWYIFYLSSLSVQVISCADGYTSRDVEIPKDLRYLAYKQLDPPGNHEQLTQSTVRDSNPILSLNRSVQVIHHVADLSSPDLTNPASKVVQKLYKYITMRLKEILTESPSTVTAYHGGGKISQLNHNSVGQGENNHLLGPGVYFGTDKGVAQGYMQYGRGSQHLYQCQINTSRIYDPVHGMPKEMRGIGDRMAQDIGFKSCDDLPNASDMQYGKWPVGQFIQHLGRDKAFALFKKHRLDGMYEQLPDQGLEIAIYNLDAVSNFREIKPEQ